MLFGFVDVKCQHNKWVTCSLGWVDGHTYIKHDILFFDYVFPKQHPVCPVLYYTAAGIERSLLNIYSILFLCKELCCTRQQRCELARNSQHRRHSVCLWLQKQAQCVHEIFLYEEWNSLGQMYQVLDGSSIVIVVTLQQAGGSVWLYLNQHGTVQSRGCLLGNVILGSSQKCRVNAM